MTTAQCLRRLADHVDGNPEAAASLDCVLLAFGVYRQTGSWLRAALAYLECRQGVKPPPPVPPPVPPSPPPGPPTPVEGPQLRPVTRCP